MKKKEFTLSIGQNYYTLILLKLKIYFIYFTKNKKEKYYNYCGGLL
jgi:hypothetical protein|nr:MAG TPA: hypothetical protein [Caudoviricetes sp.]